MASRRPPWAALRHDLGETVDIVRETVRHFATAEIDRTNECPRNLWPRRGAFGLLGVAVSEEYGGAGLGYLTHTVVMAKVSRGSASKARRIIDRRTVYPIRQPILTNGNHGRSLTTSPGRNRL